MKRSSNYVIVNVDDLGRILIPKKFRKALGISSNGIVSLELLKDSLKITMDCNKDYLSLIKDVFIKSWISCYHDHTILLVQNGLVIDIFGSMKKKLQINMLNPAIIKEISDWSFTYQKYENVRLFTSKELYSFKVIMLSSTDGIIGQLIIIDNYSISNTELSFIYSFLKQILL